MNYKFSIIFFVFSMIKKKPVIFDLLKTKKMKNILCLFVISTLLIVYATTGFAQESKWSVKADFVSSYVWRGMKIGNGPAVQPDVAFKTGGLTFDAWGNCNFAEDDSYETDLSVSYKIKLSECTSLNVLFLDVYTPDSVGAGYFNKNRHSFEPRVFLNINKFTVSGACKLHRNYVDNVYSDAYDTYLEADYLVKKNVNIFLGAGTEMYTTGDNFNICNIGVSVDKKLVVTDTFSVPFSVLAAINPASEKINVVLKITL